MRFEKVSIDIYKKDSNNPNAVIDLQQLCIPVRATLASAGYDFYAPIDFTIPPHGEVLVATGIRCKLDNDKVLTIHVRSSLGRKHGVALSNTTGIIDADYYYAENEGHILVPLRNSKDTPVVIQKGDRFVQGVILQYFTVEDDEALGVRKGGFGSTNS